MSESSTDGTDHPLTEEEKRLCDLERMDRLSRETNSPCYGFVVLLNADEHPKRVDTETDR